MRTTAAKRYQRRFSAVTSTYVALIVANVVISRALEPSQPVLALMAVVTALPIVGMIAAMGFYLRDETDEFIRNRLVTAMLIALGILFSATSILGFLQFERIVADLPVFLAFPIWCGLFGIIVAVLNWRDGSKDDAP